MSMFEVSRVSAEIGGNEISFETGKLARQASGAVVVRSGDTIVLCTATVGNLRDVDFRRGQSAEGRVVVDLSSPQIGRASCRERVCYVV